MRNTIEESLDEFRGDLNAIYLMGTTNIKSYLLRKKMLLLNSIAFPLRREGVMSLHELCREEETQMDRNQQITIRNIKAAFPAGMIELAGSYDDDSNDDTQGLTCYQDQKRELK